MSLSYALNLDTKTSLKYTFYMWMIPRWAMLLMFFNGGIFVFFSQVTSPVFNLKSIIISALLFGVAFSPLLFLGNTDGYPAFFSWRGFRWVEETPAAIVRFMGWIFLIIFTLLAGVILTQMIRK